MLTYLPEIISTFGADIDGVIRFIYWVVGIWFVAAEAILIGLIAMSRRKEGVRAKWIPGDTWAQQAWVLVPVGLVLLCDLAIEVYATPVWTKVKLDLPPADVEVRVTARQFMWLFTYAGPDGRLGTVDDFQATEMHVPKDKVVRFQLESADVLHAFFVRELRLKQDAVPGRSIPGWFQATQEGTYEIACAEICGKAHTKMRGLLVVDSQEAYDTWTRQQQGGAQ